MTSKAENCYVALQNLLKNVVGMGNIAGIPNVSRELKEPSQVPPDTMPALYINQTGQLEEPTKGFEGLHSKETLTCDLYLYVTKLKAEDIASTQINEMIQAIRDALYPTPPSMYQTLNDTVSHCWISGKIEIIEGILNGQGIAIIPVNILTNN